MEREKHKIPKFQGTKSELISILKNARFTRRAREHRNFPSVFGDRTSFRAKGLSRHTQNRNFISVFGDRRSFLAKGLRPTLQNRNFTSVFFGYRTSFRAKGLSRHTQNRNLTSAFAIEARFLRKGCGRHSETAVLPQFFFRQSNLVSCERVVVAQSKS